MKKDVKSPIPPHPKDGKTIKGVAEPDVVKKK